MKQTMLCLGEDCTSVGYLVGARGRFQYSVARPLSLSASDPNRNPRTHSRTSVETPSGGSIMDTCLKREHVLHSLRPDSCLYMQRQRVSRASA